MTYNIELLYSDKLFPTVITIQQIREIGESIRSNRILTCCKFNTGEGKK